MTLYPIEFGITANNVCISDATLSIWSSDFTLHICTVNTSILGTAIVGLPNGIYRVFISKTGYVTSDSFFTITVADAPAKVNYVIYKDVEESVPDGKVLLYGYVKSITSAPIVGATVLVRVGTWDQYTNTTVWDKHDISTITNEAGYYSFILNAGLSVTLVIAYSNFMKTGVLPLSGRISGPTLDHTT